MNQNQIVYYADDYENSVNIRSIIMDLSDVSANSIHDINRVIANHNNIIYSKLIISNNFFTEGLNLILINNITYCKNVIADNIGLVSLDLNKIPRNIKTISLKYNNISDFLAFKLTAKCKTLLEINLIGNKITNIPNFRITLLNMIPSLVRINGEKISKNERRASKILNTKNTETITKVAIKAEKNSNKIESITEALKQQLMNAETLEEIDRLEKELSKYS
ncbi:hypothetical protein QEN19_000360 [Hanseniaspora menglaensis]